VSIIGLDEISTVGANLARAECVLCTANGRTFVSDWRGGVTILEPDGSQWSLLAREAAFEVQPNGITLMEDGSVLLCHLGAEQGGVYRLTEAADIHPFLTEVDGEALPPTNYAHLDENGRVWVTVSTRVIRIAPDGTHTTMIEDNEPDHVARVEAAFQAGTMGRPDLDNAHSRKLRNISSLAFGGADMRTAHLGCLLDTTIYTFRSPCAGHPPPHWRFPGPRRCT